MPLWKGFNSIDFYTSLQPCHFLEVIENTFIVTFQVFFPRTTQRCSIEKRFFYLHFTVLNVYAPNHKIIFFDSQPSQVYVMTVQQVKKPHKVITKTFI